MQSDGTTAHMLYIYTSVKNIYIWAARPNWYDGNDIDRFGIVAAAGCYSRGYVAVSLRYGWPLKRGTSVHMRTLLSENKYLSEISKALSSLGMLDVDESPSCSLRVSHAVDRAR